MQASRRIFDLVTAALSGGLALAIGGVLKAAEHFGLVLPDWAWATYGIVSLLLALIVMAALCHFAWGWLRARGMGIAPLIGMGLGFLLFVACGAWAVVRTPGLFAPPNKVSFQKYAVFWVQKPGGVFQIGTVAKLFNAEGGAERIAALGLNDLAWTFIPRGGYQIGLQLMTEYCPSANIIENDYLKAGEEGYFKQQLPLKFAMSIISGKTPDLVLRGDWTLKVVGGAQTRLTPRLYAVYPDPISEAQWDDLLKSQSTIKVDDLIYREIPKHIPPDAPYRSFMIYNRDPSATIDDPYIAQTPSVRGPSGTLIVIRTQRAPPSSGGWEVLGDTYAAVWSNPEKLALYNSLYAPDEAGNPRAFGFIAGAENEMAGNVGRALSAPTTRAADILDFHPTKEQMAEIMRKCAPSPQAAER